MSLFRHLTHGLRVLLNRRAADRDLAEEVKDYLEQATAAHIAAGLSSEQARRATQLEFGNQTAIREQVRSYGWENALDTFLADLRCAARQLRSAPGFAAVSIATLALGISGATAIFSAVNPILFEPLPYPRANRIVMLWDKSHGSRLEVTFHTYRELITRSHSFEAAAVAKAWQPTMTSAAQPERFDGQSVSANYFRVLGLSPVLGRDFQEADDQVKGPKVAILSDRFWRRRFNADISIVGRQVTLDDSLYTVIGVMPKNFENVLSPSAELWCPLQYDTNNIANPDTQEWGHHLRLVGRLRLNLSADQANKELDQIALTPAPEFPRPRWAALTQGVIVNTLKNEITSGVKPALLAVLGAVMLVLLIACVNVTNLLLARAAQRRGEFAMRVALGAERSRLIRQLLTESLLLAAAGGALALVLAQFGVRALVALSPAGLPRVDSIAVDTPAFLFALGIAALIGLCIGLVPALEASRPNVATAMQQVSRRTAGSRQFTRRLLVVSEIAFALVLLVTAGLLLRSLQRLFSISTGFDASHVLTMQVHESGRRFATDAARHRFFAQSLEAVRRVPGVTSAAYTSLLPLSGDPYGIYGAQFEKGDSYNVFRYVVTPGYIETMGIALRRGRLLDTRDTNSAPFAALISESLAKSKFAGQEAIGQRIHLGLRWYTITGVVADVKQASLAEGNPNAVYITPAQSWFVDTTLSLVVRATGDVAALAPAIRSAIWSIDKDQPILRVATMDGLLTASESARRFSMIVFEAFAFVALLLSATGIYGVLSGSVTERTREIGVRAALGASRVDILRLILRQGMTLTGLGVLIGLSGAAAATQAVVTLLFGVSRLDPLTYLAVVALLFSVSAIACWIPAWRAARVDPAITLRAE
jgi:putative ABC transport system permease protein